MEPKAVLLVEQHPDIKALMDELENINKEGQAKVEELKAMATRIAEASKDRKKKVWEKVEKAVADKGLLPRDVDFNKAHVLKHGYGAKNKKAGMVSSAPVSAALWSICLINKAVLRFP